MVERLRDWKGFKLSRFLIVRLIVKNGLDLVTYELNIHHLELGDLYYEPCPGMNAIVNASRTFHKKLAD